MVARKLKLLALHGFRTSGHIFAQQMEISGLSEKLKDLIDIVYVSAPNAASGPLPADVPAEIFKGPYFEWWNAVQDPNTKEALRYVGWDESLAFIKDYITMHGPFDGFLAFSQGTILASLLLSMKRSGQILQQPQAPRFALLFGGVIPAPVMQRQFFVGGLLRDHSVHVIGERDFARKSHPPFQCIVCIGGVKPGAAVVQPLYSEKMQLPSLHIIGDRDGVKKWSYKLVETFENPVVITHPRGHVVPRLEGESLATMRAFLQAQLQESAL